MNGLGVTEIVIGSNLTDSVLEERAGRAKVLILAQPSVNSLAHALSQTMENVQVQVKTVPDRDEAKTLRVAEEIYEDLARFGLGRDDTVVCVGGGAVTDLGGFVAGTWLRGVEVVHYPTTLLAAVDASIGGKTGVNLAGKNLVGVFWHPGRVVIDLEILRELPRNLMREGLAEALKTGLIGDGELFSLLEEHGAEAPLEEMVRRAVSVKTSIVARDERERGDRVLLNLGHTFGHALEYATSLSHGEAVAVGTTAAAQISAGKLGFTGADRVETALTRLELPVKAPSGAVRGELLALMGLDKKRDAAGIRMVLLEEIGRPVVVHVSDDDLQVGLDAIGL